MKYFKNWFVIQKIDNVKINDFAAFSYHQTCPDEDFPFGLSFRPYETYKHSDYDSTRLCQ